MRLKGAGSLVIMNSVPILAEKPSTSPPCGDKLEFEEHGAQENEAISHYYIMSYRKPTVGFEPTTTGLQNQRTKHLTHLIINNLPGPPKLTWRPSPSSPDKKYFGNFQNIYI